MVRRYYERRVLGGQMILISTKLKKFEQEQPFILALVLSKRLTTLLKLSKAEALTRLSLCQEETPTKLQVLGML